MKEAYLQAEMAFQKGEIPVGAIIVHNQQVLARAHNLVETLQDPTAHAEMLAITAACHKIGAKYLQDCTLYVTLEPCPMCAGALHWSQLAHVYFGASDPKKGIVSAAIYQNLPARPTYTGGIYDEPCRLILKKFFEELRR